MWTVAVGVAVRAHTWLTRPVPCAPDQAKPIMWIKYAFHDVTVTLTWTGHTEPSVYVSNTSDICDPLYPVAHKLVLPEAGMWDTVLSIYNQLARNSKKEVSLPLLANEL